jgi:trehalose synthase
MQKILSEVRLKKLSFESYKKFIKAKDYKQLKSLGKDLKNLSIIHINSTSAGGGVAELLKSQVPYERSLGIKSRWIVLNGLCHKDNFFTITKKIHNFLQGEKGRLKNFEKKIYLSHNQAAFSLLRKIIKQARPDIIIIHDPQPLPLVNAIPADIFKIFRLHIDLSSPNQNVLGFLKPFILAFDRLVVTANEYRPKWFPKGKTSVIYPSIDPLLEKNKKLSKNKAGKILIKSGVSLSAPIISQVSRFDPWKDPIGVIRAFNIARKKIAGLKLILIGSAADDDPEGKEVFEKVKKFVNNDSDIFLFTRHNDLLVNAIQEVSSVVLQKSLREGFGLTATEAMWKAKAIIGGNTIGLRLQIKDKENGFIVKNSKEAGKRIIELIKNPKLAGRLGKRAQKTVQEKFILPIMVLSHFKLYKEALSQTEE